MRFAMIVVALLVLSGCAGIQGETRSNASDPGTSTPRPRESWFSRHVRLDRLWRREPSPATPLVPSADVEGARARSGATDGPAVLLLPEGKEDPDEPVAGRLLDPSVRAASRPAPGPAD